ncbi:MAG TPA: hypothetical protein VGS13_01075 [Stellaceae bacterium]|nr:hypothetical protein [Stellaceae bacterium]
MAHFVPHPRHSLERWLRRIDRAAGIINPFLLVLAIGLAVLNMTAIVLLAPHLAITSDTPGLGLAAASCPPSPATDPVTAPPGGDVKAWGF